MPNFQIIDHDDIEEIDYLAIEQLHAIGSIVPPEITVWHYTNGTALIAILDSMSLFATHVSCLNDASELRYATSLYRRAIYELTKSHTGDDQQGRAFLEFALEYYAEGPQSSQSSQYFVTCFSEERDDLSQWRAYGGDNGFAIGFKAADLIGIMDASLTRVCYDVEMQQALVQKLAQTMFEYYLFGLEKHCPNDIASWQKEFLRVWDAAMTMMMAASIKNPAFSREREVRITKSVSPRNNPAAALRNLRFIQKSNIISRHLPIRFGPDPFLPEAYYRLPISEIMVGPCMNPRINGASVEAILQQKGYSSVKISHSRVPLRSV